MRYKFEPGLISAIREADDGNGNGYSTTYIQVSLNRETGEVFGAYHCSVGQNEWNQYSDPAIITVGNYAGVVTRRELAAAIDRRLYELEAAR